MPFLLQDERFPHLVPRAQGLPAKIFDQIMKIRKELPATTDRGRLIARTYLEMILVMLINHYKGQFATAGALSAGNARWSGFARCSTTLMFTTLNPLRSPARQTLWG